MAKEKIKAKSLKVNLPFGLGALEFEEDVSQQKAAWKLYVELSTRISTQPLGDDEGMIREALSSLYSLFSITREILKDAGPEIGKGANSLGSVAVDVLNIGLRPFLAKWHPLLKAYEEQKPASVTSLEYERHWPRYKEMRGELHNVQKQMIIYINALAKISGIKGFGA
ncbi:MAG: hypothetical protein IT310_04900 [Anaerolineales bacterium]|nr:hypothetical protein [Anaerolineales bacterium]